jgi:hypothetical protein
VADEWIDGAAEVAERTNHPEALRLMEYAEERVALGVPIEAGIRDLYAQPPEPDIDYFYLTPIMPEDENRLEAADPRLEFLRDNPSSVARFTEGSRAVYLSPLKMSRLGRGVILLHELGHVVRHPGDAELTQDEAQVWQEEAEVFAFEFEILESLFGKTYDRALNHFIERAIKRDEEINPKPLEKVIAKTLGTSPDENGFWVGMFTLHAQWRFLQQFDSNPLTTLAEILKEEYIGDHDTWG